LTILIIDQFIIGTKLLSFAVRWTRWS